jgi:hypothetical protein
MGNLIKTKSRVALLAGNIILSVILLVSLVNCFTTYNQLISWGVPANSIFFTVILDLVQLVLIWIAYVRYDSSRAWSIFILILGIICIMAGIIMILSQNWFLLIAYMLVGISFIMSYVYKRQEIKNLEA